MKGPKRQVFSHQPSQPSRRAEPSRATCRAPIRRARRWGPAAPSPTRAWSPRTNRRASVAHAPFRARFDFLSAWVPRTVQHPIASRHVSRLSATNSASNQKLPRGIHFSKQPISDWHVASTSLSDESDGATCPPGCDLNLDQRLLFRISSPSNSSFNGK